MKILYKYTTRSRRDNFLRGIDSIVKNTVDKDNYHILISVENEPHDSKMHPLPQLQCNHTYKVNPSAPTSKIDAINRDVNEFNYDWDILVNMSDDMLFTQKGFDNIIRESFDSLDLFIHFPDGNRNDLCTMSIMDRKYYERFNYIYHPDYKSLWCDNEAQEVANILGCYKFVNKNILKHLHPAYNLGTFDAQYQHTETFNGHDAEVYRRRKQNNFDL